jgi:hypothetical protein
LAEGAFGIWIAVARVGDSSPQAQCVGKRRLNNFPFGAFIPLENAQGEVFVALHCDVREEGLVCVIDSMCNR